MLTNLTYLEHFVLHSISVFHGGSLNVLRGYTNTFPTLDELASRGLVARLYDDTFEQYIITDDGEFLLRFYGTP